MATSYYMKFEDSLYRFLLPVLKKFDRLVKNKKQFRHTDLRIEHDTILVGYDRIGYSVYKTLKKQKREVVIVDFNPDIITNLMKKNVPCIYGDISDDEVLYELELNKVKLLISTIPNTRDTLLLIEKVRKMNQHAKIIVTAYLVEDALQLYQAGADYVILPHLLGGKHASILLEDISFDVDKLIKTKLTHINELKHHKHRFSTPVLD